MARTGFRKYPVSNGTDGAHRDAESPQEGAIEAAGIPKKAAARIKQFGMASARSGVKFYLVTCGGAVSHARCATSEGLASRGEASCRRGL
jgi:hypothetical protein